MQTFICWAERWKQVVSHHFSLRRRIAYFDQVGADRRRGFCWDLLQWREGEHQRVQLQKSRRNWIIDNRRQVDELSA